MNSNKYGNLPATTHGKSFASFGEIAQGRLSNGDDFLLTLPVDLWSECKLTCNHQPEIGTPQVTTPLPKAKYIATLLLKRLDTPQNLSLRLEFKRNIPIGKGLSSSTADMLAVARAFQSAFDLQLTQEEISTLFTHIEPHDPLHYSCSVAYNHRQGRLLKSLDYIPQFHIIGIDSGGVLSTEDYNKHLHYSPGEMREYDLLYQSLLEAFARKDDGAIAQCAQRSAALHASRTNNSFLSQLLDISKQLDTLGLIATHSGTCAGLLLSPDSPAELRRYIRHSVAHLGRVFETKTLAL